MIIIKERSLKEIKFDTLFKTLEEKTSLILCKKGPILSNNPSASKDVASLFKIFFLTWIQEDIYVVF